MLGCPFQILLYAGITLELYTLRFLDQEELLVYLCCLSTVRFDYIGKVVKIGQSAGKTFKTFREQLIVNTMNTIHSEFNQKVLLESSETTRKNMNKELPIVLSIHRPSHRYPELSENNEDFAYYLAGLMDGDGYISRMEDQPQIVISFHSKDISLAYHIKKVIGFGTVTHVKTKNAVHYLLTNVQGLLFICKLISNRLRIQRKMDRLNDLKVKLNVHIVNPNITSLMDTHYFAGLIDSAGSLSIRTFIRSTTRKEVRLLLRIEFIDEPIISEIYNTFGGYKCTRIQHNWTSYCWSSVSHQNMKVILKYLDKYHLCSKKYLEYIYVRKAYLFIQDKQHLSESGFNTIQDYSIRVQSLKK